MSELILDDVSKIYAAGEARAVDGVSMRIRDGEIVALLGSSGCGKTSTLRMIAGFEDVTGGTIRLGERIVASANQSLRPAERNVAMAFEGYALYPPLSVRDNIAFSLLKAKTDRAAIDRRVGEIAEMLDITGLLDKYPPSISGGQQQRVSLARALIRNDASVYLLDEPMSQLEPQLRALLRARIKEYMIAHRMTTVIVTHDQTEAIALSDRVAVMDKGILQQLGTPAELRERPANLFVASFIGEPPMNVFDARVDGDRLAVFDDRARPAFGIAGYDVAARSGQALRVGIRPHRIAPGVAAPGMSVVQGTVLSSHWLGDHIHVAVDVGGCFLIAVGDRDAAAPAGSVIPVSIPLDALHVFDAGSGLAIQHGLTPIARPAAMSAA